LHGTRCGAAAGVPIFLDIFAKIVAAKATEEHTFVSLSGKFLLSKMG
jgi:hypothetical protein